MLYRREYKTEVKGRGGGRRRQIVDGLKETRVLEIERGSTRSHSVENSVCKRLLTCRKADCVVMVVIISDGS
jgi:hypothetical protein